MPTLQSERWHGRRIMDMSKADLIIALRAETLEKRRWRDRSEHFHRSSTGLWVACSLGWVIAIGVGIKLIKNWEVIWGG